MGIYDKVEIYVKEKYNCTVKPCWIAHMKEICGINVRIAHNRIDINKRTNPCPVGKQDMIREAFKHLGLL